MSANVTDAQRIARTLQRLHRWVSNYEANSQREADRENYDEARRLMIRANDIRDIIAMLDGTDDEYIARLAEWDPREADA